MLSLVKRFFREDEAVTMVEYALMVSLVAIAAILGATALGTKLNNMYNGTQAKMTVPT